MAKINSDANSANNSSTSKKGKEVVLKTKSSEVKREVNNELKNHVSSFSGIIRFVKGYEPATKALQKWITDCNARNNQAFTLNQLTTKTIKVYMSDSERMNSKLEPRAKIAFWGLMNVIQRQIKDRANGSKTMKAFNEKEATQRAVKYQEERAAKKIAKAA